MNQHAVLGAPGQRAWAAGTGSTGGHQVDKELMLLMSNVNNIRRISS